MADSPEKYVVTVNNGRMRLQCRRGMTLYAALRTNGILMPTGCGARGQCGQCKAQVYGIGGGLLTDAEARLITEADRAAGWRLTCQVRLEGDVDVMIPEYVFGAREYDAVLREVTSLTADIRRFSFLLKEGETVPHRAGQFVTLSMKVPDVPGRVMRCFSFATPGSIADRVDMIIRRNPRGVLTPFLFDGVRVGEEAKILAPYGDFYLRDSDVPCIWIAGGSGLSPFLGMVQDLIDQDRKRPVHLFFGAVLPVDLYYVDLLKGIARQHDWFQFTPALSGDERIDSCEDYGLITEVVARHVGDASGSEGYLCGGPGMIAACLKVLSEKGMPRANVYYDRF